MKKSVTKVVALLLTASMVLGGCSGAGKEPASTEPAQEETKESTESASTNNDDLLGADIGDDYGLGPVGFDLNTLVERMGDTVPNLTLGVSTSSLTSPWMIDWCNEFEKLSEKYGFELVVLNGSNNQDPTQQVADLKSMQTQQVDGIMVFCEFPDATAPIINELYNQDIPVISAIAPTEEMKIAGWANVSQEDKGMAMARQAAEDFGEEDAYILLTDTSFDLPNLRQRVAGFIAEAEKYPNLHIVEERREGTPDGFVNTVKEALISNEDINAVFCTFGAGAIYDQNAAEQLGRNDVKIYGVDAEEAGLEMLKEGKLAGLQAQWARVNASLCLFQLLRTINGDQMEPEIWEPDNYALCVATPETAQQYLDWFYPEQ